MNKGDVIVFDAKKNFTFIKMLGVGGTGDTRLFKDETTDMMFAIKKYVPMDKRFVEEHYKRFVDEIKILFNISHPNIVRIYNYYLYPDAKTGYLQMEYIDGTSIDKYEPFPWDYGDWNRIFNDVIKAFEYLEQHHILHRDIRPANIMIDSQNNVKIIDFGFGKQFKKEMSGENSVILNWPVTEMPDEVVQEKEYDEQTEIFFVGTLFRHILKSKYLDEFKYGDIIEKMTKSNPAQRYLSFSDVVNNISSGLLSEIDFLEDEKETYRNFAWDLAAHITCFTKKYSPINDSTITLDKLAELLRKSSLEQNIQDNSMLIGCFIDGNYRYKTRKDIETQTVIDFYNLVNRLSPIKQKIVFENIYTRLATIPVEPEVEDLPF